MLSLFRKTSSGAHCGFPDCATAACALWTAAGLRPTREADVFAGWLRPWWRDDPQGGLNRRLSLRFANLGACRNSEPQGGKQSAYGVVTARKLLAVAQGDSPAKADAIIDVVLTDFPAHPLGHKDYERRLQFRTEALAKNKANKTIRRQLTLEAWTELYTLLSASCETTAPMLHRELETKCDLSVTDLDKSRGFFLPKRLK